MSTSPITPDMLINAYCQGAFPMAEGGDGPIYWYSPDPRGILPLDAVHFPKSLLRRYRSGRFDITRDQAFEQVMRACTLPRKPKPDQPNGQWISEPLIHAYCSLHRMGLAHSVEAWLADDHGNDPVLVGGLYGVALGAAFFGESMFYRATDASKVCLVHLVEHLIARDYELLDMQMVTAHTAQFGGVLISKANYMKKLRPALEKDIAWD